LRVRNRRPGDRLRPVGLGGSKKVQDVLVDRKVSRRDRDAVPIITDADDRIVWVAGHALGEAFRVTEATKGVIILKLRRI
jgi:tRNA(Ile)-lysidine synthase